MLNSNDIPEQVLRDIVGAYHRRLAMTNTEAQDENERDFQRIAYLRTAMAWMALWLNGQAAPVAPTTVAVPDDSHPMQPIVLVDGVARFKQNAIVRYLLDNGGLDLNALALVGFSQEDNEQFAQLIGYSVSGFGDLSYARSETVGVADAIVDALLASQPAAPVAPATVAVLDGVWPERFVCANPEEHFLQFQSQPKLSDIPEALVKHPDTMASQQFVDGWNACRDTMLAASKREGGGT